MLIGSSGWWRLIRPCRRCSFVRYNSSAHLRRSDDVSSDSLHSGVGSSDVSNVRPSALVEQLDRFIIGQNEAKRAVAVALRNRWRRHQLPIQLRDDVTPKNILMIGPTGSGKTEIARRLAKLTCAPFIKVEATKFTETGFHGKDVDTIIVDLVRTAIVAERTRHKDARRHEITAAVEQRILDALIGVGGGVSRDEFLSLLRRGALDQQEIDIEVAIKADTTDTAPTSASASGGASDRAIEFALRGLSGSIGGGNGRREMRRLKIADAIPILEENEYEQISAHDDIAKQAIRAVEQDGIVFIDEIDKICSNATAHRHADASAEGVQRDLLPIIEGTTVSTKHGDVQTDHILFIASGAFHSVKPSDMLAELQGRLPIRVQLAALTEDELYQVLTMTEHNLIKQQIALLQVDDVRLTFTDDAVREIAKIAAQVNRTVEDIGARRLHTIVERVMDDDSFNAADLPAGTEIVIDRKKIQEKLADIFNVTDMTKFIL